MTIGQCLQQGRKRLAPAILDAELLLAHILGQDRLYLVIHARDEIPRDRAEQYFALIERRKAGEPAAYLTGEKEFMSLPFTVHEGVLIPRPDTETLVEFVMRRLNGRVANVLDLCTGSGCVAVSLAYYLPEASVTAVDILEICVQVAKGNAERNGVASRVAVRQADMMEEMEFGIFDCIVSNPPYIRPEVIDTLEVDVRGYEPHLALDGGPDGLRFYRRIVELVPSCLRSGGLLAVEIGYDQAAQVEGLFKQSGLFEQTSVEKDLAGNDRVAWGRLKN